ncbi:glyoxalase superfamily protein [Pantoea stewartii]|uniref:glyoxalase superfamily protein n=1 Tax=Pantoea stewartii TaxID=66269 RepID=UPI00345B5B6F
MRNYRDAKHLAQSLRHALLDKKNVYLGHSESLEIVSKMFGVRDWNTLAAKITEKNTKSDLKEAASEKDKADNHECCFHAEGVHRFEGFYKEKSHSVMKIYVVKNKIFGQMTGQIPVEIFQKDEFSFEATRYGIRVRFCCDKNKVINGFILEQNGKRSFWQSITQKEALTIESALKKRIEESLATPGSEKALHDLILCIYSN